MEKFDNLRDIYTRYKNDTNTTFNAEILKIKLDFIEKGEEKEFNGEVDKIEKEKIIATVKMMDEAIEEDHYVFFTDNAIFDKREEGWRDIIRDDLKVSYCTDTFINFFIERFEKISDNRTYITRLIRISLS